MQIGYYFNMNDKVTFPKGSKILFECVAGSHLYGTSTPTSDEDIRGVFVPPKEYFIGFQHHIKQVENKTQDIVYYDIRKFLALCCDNNPNIIELLFVPYEQWRVKSLEWEWIVANRDIFLSKKARWTFSGYAVSQLHRIKQHRAWLLNPPKKQPERKDFGLPEDKTLVSKEQLNTYNELVERAQDVSIDKLNELVWQLQLDVNAMVVLQHEKAFLNANRVWGQYMNWKQNRNPERAAIEEKWGYDTKHAAHLYRLISEGEELLLKKNITFPRFDADMLREIKQGKYTYDELMSMVGDIDAKFNSLYQKSSLPIKPDSNKADALCCAICEAVLSTQVLKTI